MLKAIVSSQCLSNYCDLFNLCHLIRQWCSTTHTFFLPYGKINMTLNDVVSQLLLPILGDTNPDDIALSAEEGAVETELKKGVSRNTKLSHWVGAFLKASTAVRRAAFITFWLCKFVFSLHPHYVVKPLYFRLAIKISTRASLPLAPMFLGHLYIQLDIP